MLKDQFFMRLMLVIAVGIVYVKAYMNMAKRNSKETEHERHLVLKIFGGIWTFLGVLMGVIGVYLITQITFPQEAIGPYISPYMIVRSTDQTMYWGYATMRQSQCISLISGFFEAFALSAYCFLYKSSHSKWYTKVGKIVFCILFYMFYASATDFHFFDLYEWTAPVLFAIMAFFAFRNKNEHETNNISNTDTHKNIESFTDNEVNDDYSRYMPSAATGTSVVQDNIQENVKEESAVLTTEQDEPESLDKNSSTEIIENETEMTSDCLSEQDIVSPIPEQTIKYCRHCGGRLDYINDKYCKYCGKPLL